MESEDEIAARGLSNVGAAWRTSAVTTKPVPQNKHTASSQGWADKLQGGMTFRELAHALVDSPEHMQRFYNPNEGRSVPFLGRATRSSRTPVVVQ
jgi:hypothetical protein